MNKLWGQHPGIRANHAKGVVVEGTFTPTKDAAALSKAALFQGKAIPVTARFSDSTGLPDIPDGDENANPHGMAVKFRLPDGSDVDIVENSLKLFPRGDRRGVPRPAASRRREPPGRRQADEDRAVLREPSRGPACLRLGRDPGKLCARDLQRHRRVRVRGRRGQAPALPLSGRARRRDRASEPRGGREAEAGLPR